MYIVNVYYDRIDVYKGIDVNKTSRSKEYDTYQPNVCNRCHDLLMMSIKLCDIAILNIKGSDYHCIISLISKKDSIKFMQNADLTEKRRAL